MAEKSCKISLETNLMQGNLAVQRIEGCFVLCSSLRMKHCEIHFLGGWGEYAFESALCLQRVLSLNYSMSC